VNEARLQVEVIPIHIPVLTHFSVRSYGMFPGKDGEGIDASLHPGLTLVLGTNGLGKSTLVFLLYRLLTGPHDIPGLSSAGELGTSRLEPVQLTGYARRTFARRVSDAALTASASLSFTVGTSAVSMERRLSDLGLLRLAVDGQEVDRDEISSYQPHITELCGLGSFGDFVLCLPT
jgi:hypothetical protein